MLLQGNPTITFFPATMTAVVLHRNFHVNAETFAPSFLCALAH